MTQPSLASAGSYFLRSPPVLTRDHVSINSLQVNLCVRVHVLGTVVCDRPSHYSDFVSSSSFRFLILPPPTQTGSVPHPNGPGNRARVGERRVHRHTAGRAISGT